MMCAVLIRLMLLESVKTIDRTNFLMSDSTGRITITTYVYKYYKLGLI